MLRGELSTLSLGMFGKCEWWSVLEPKCVCGWVEGFGGSSCIFVGTFFFDNLSCSGITVDYVFFLVNRKEKHVLVSDVGNFTSVEIPDKSLQDSYLQ